MLLVLKQPDLGTALTYLPVLIAGLFLGGIRVRQVATPPASGFAILAGGAWPQRQTPEALSAGPHQQLHRPRHRPPRRRAIRSWQSRIAVGSGGLWGKGTNQGTQTQGDFLPIPYTDFIFAAFCEEHGFVGGIGILLLYFLILTRLIQNAQQASDAPGTFIIMGVVASSSSSRSS